MVAVPWGAIAAEPTKYLMAGQVPVTIKIREPSKMSAIELRNLFNFWVKRQMQELVVFRFKYVEPAHVRVAYGSRKRDLDWDGMDWMQESDGEMFQLSEEETAVREGKKWKGKGR